MTGLRYLEGRSRARTALAPRHQRFAALRDEFVINLTYNTARAYASDLDHLFDWALAHGKDVLELTGADISLYVGGLLHHPYTVNTIIRKRTALRGFYELAVAKQAVIESPLSDWGPIRRRLPAARSPRSH